MQWLLRLEAQIHMHVTCSCHLIITDNSYRPEDADEAADDRKKRFYNTYNKTAYACQ